MPNVDAQMTPKLASALGFIETNFKKDISVVDVAQQANMSLFHFIREFKRSLGVTPRQYLIQSRIKYSKMLLRGTDMTVKKITYAIGYKDSVHFVRLFKSSEGMTPAVYRQSAIATITSPVQRKA